MTAMTLTHKFVSAIADGTDATLVRPSSWNDQHAFFYGYRTVTIATDTIANADHLSLIVYNGAGAIAASLPAPTAGNFQLGWRCWLTNNAASPVTLTGTGGATINGATSITINQGDEYDLQGTGTSNFFAQKIISEAANDGNFYARRSLGWSNIGATFAPLASPALSGTPTGPTAVAGTNTTQLATTAFVMANAGTPGGAATTVQTRVFTASGPYVPSAGLVSAIVETIAGGAGGGAVGSGSGYNAAGAGGGSGSYSRKALTAAQIGASQTITIGPGGAGGLAAGPNNGSPGGNTSFGSLCIANGGLGGAAASAGSAASIAIGGAGGAPGTGDVVAAGNPGVSGGQGSGPVIPPPGASSALGGGAVGVDLTTTLPGGAARNYGAGGSGASCSGPAGSSVGGNGSPGVCVVTEFINTAVAAVGPIGGLLSYVSTTALKFAPYAGSFIRLNGAIRGIPSAGIAGMGSTGVFVNGVAAQNLVANTTYWIFCFDNGGVLTADFRTAATHATSTTAGNEGTEILTGNDTRSLIGMCRSGAAAGVFLAPSATNLSVLNWFNKKTLRGQGVFTAERSLSSATPVEINTEIRVNFLSWTDPVQIVMAGAMLNSAVDNVYAFLAVDATVIDGGCSYYCSGVNFQGVLAGSSQWIPTEGWHTATIYGKASTGTAAYGGSAAPATPSTTNMTRCSLSVGLQG
jgi:hypothetical protein